VPCGVRHLYSVVDVRLWKLHFWPQILTTIDALKPFPEKVTSWPPLISPAITYNFLMINYKVLNDNHTKYISIMRNIKGYTRISVNVLS
jgi:hypothetical protein